MTLTDENADANTHNNNNTSKMSTLSRIAVDNAAAAALDVADEFESSCSENARKIIERRYLMRDPKQLDTPIETIAEMLRRVCHRIADVEKERYGATAEEVDHWYKVFLNTLCSRRGTPAGRTLANAGNDIARTFAANCVVLHVEDSLDHIFHTLHQAAMLQQAGAGVGFPLHLMRPAGLPVVTSQSTSSGPISFLEVFDSAFKVIKQQNRHGANMAVMRVDHPDILEFVNCKRVEGSISCFNISVGITHEFMRQVHDESYRNVPWVCTFADKQYPVRRITRTTGYNRSVHVEDTDMSARDLFDEIVDAAWSNGEPGVVFLDTVNESNPLPGLGAIESCNPCVTAETWVHTSEGPRQVQELVDSERPFTAIVNGKPYDASPFFETGVKRVYKLRTSHGYSVSATANHRIAVKDTRKWVPLGDLRAGDEVVLNRLPYMKCSSTSYTWTEANNESIYEYDDGYDMGCFYAVDCADEDIYSSEHDSAAEQDNSEHDFSFVHSSTSSFHKGFLSGVFDTLGKRCDDGGDYGCETYISVCLPKYDEWCERRQALLTHVQRMLLRFGIVCSVTKNSDKESCNDDNGDILIIDGTTSVALFENIFDTLCSKERDDEHECTMVEPCSDDYYTTVVEVVELDSAQRTYDCTVDKVHAFDADGILVHNCGEQFLHDGDVCNLGHVNVAAHVTDNGKLDERALADTTKVMIRLLDNVVDCLEMPSQRVQEAIVGNRRLGLGVMGVADMLYEMKLRYASDEAVQLCEHVMCIIQKAAEEESEHLANSRGNFPNYEHSVFAKLEPPVPRRNAALTSVAPTGTTALAMDVNGGIEPFFSLSYMREVGSGDNKQLLKYCNEAFRAVAHTCDMNDSHEAMLHVAESGSIDSIPAHVALPQKFVDAKHVFCVAPDLTPEEHVKMQAAFQAHCDNAISKTINFGNNATRAHIADTYKRAWAAGCKGCTIYRDGSRVFQILKTKADGDDESDDATDDEGRLTEGEYVSIGSISSSSDDCSSDSTGSDSGGGGGGGSCPECSWSLRMEQGCSTCTNSDCGYSACDTPTRRQYH